MSMPLVGKGGLDKIQTDFFHDGSLIGRVDAGGHWASVSASVMIMMLRLFFP